MSYEQIKSCVNNLAQKVAKVPVRMEISPFNNEDPAAGAQEPLESFGKGPAGGVKPGKGAGQQKGGKGDSSKGKETRACHNCGKKGHLARDCWQDKKNGGKGKDPRKRERGSDGKWYRRTGPGIFFGHWTKIKKTMTKSRRKKVEKGLLDLSLPSDWVVVWRMRMKVSRP